MSFHYGQRVEVYLDGEWEPGTVDTEGAHDQLRVDMDDGQVIWEAPFYIRPSQEVRA